MARERVLKVTVLGDDDHLERMYKRAGDAGDKFAKQTKLTASITSKGYSAMRIGATGAAAAAGGLVLVGKKVVDAAIESEKAEAKLAAQLKASGISYKAHAKEIDAVIQKTSQLAGLDDEELTDAFTNVVRSTGDVSVALKDMTLVADLARGKNMDVAKAGELVAKIHAGSVGPLKRMGIEYVKTTENVDKLRASTKNATPEQLAAAKAADTQANSQRALALLQQKVSGQAEAYGKTTAGAMDRAEVAAENLEETIGAALAPTVERTANKIADFVNEMQDGTGQGGRFAAKLKDIWQDAKPIVTWIGRATKNVAQFTAEHPNVAKLAAAVVGVGVAVKGLKFVSAATGFTDLIKAGRGAARTLTRVLGNAGTAAGEEVAANAAAGMNANSGRVTSASRSIGKKAGKGLVLGIVLALPALVPAIRDELNKLPKTDIGKYLFAPLNLGKKIGGAISGLFGDGPGRSARGSAANLMGASATLAPFASFGTGLGLHVSSGLRPGARTTSGNRSYHASGHAIDMAGPPGKMMAFFKALKSRYGGILAELIYTPGGVGIKNGRPHRYTGAVAADHFDHVHVAYGAGDGSGRAPGTGDGYGKGSIMNLWTRAGGSAKIANLAAAVALAESGGESTASNRNSDGSIDRGLWQINSVHGKLSTFDPLGNARAAVKISSGGKNWSPWVAWQKGLHKRFLAGGGASPVAAAGRAAPSSVDRAEAQEKAGSRIVNALTRRYGPAINRAGAAAARTSTLMEDANTAYGQLERRFGQTDEDLGTAAGRAKRLDELAALKDEKRKQLDRAKRRASHLHTKLARLENLIKAARRKRDKARGVTRARIVKRIHDFEDQRTDVAAELKAIELQDIPDLELDIGDLAKEAADVAATEDTAGEPPESATDILSRTLGDIDAQERAGVITPQSAQAQRIAYLQRAIAGEFGGMSQRELWDAMGQLREVQQQAVQTVADNTAALKDLEAAIAESNAIANSTIGIQLREAQRAFGDLLTGELGGRVTTRGYMPGSGQLTRL